MTIQFDSLCIERHMPTQVLDLPDILVKPHGCEQIRTDHRCQLKCQSGLIPGSYRSLQVSRGRRHTACRLGAKSRFHSSQQLREANVVICGKLSLTGTCPQKAG